MSIDCLNLKSICNKVIKYFIFIFSFLCAFVAMGIGGGKVQAIESATYTIHQSNHEGNNEGTDPNAAIKQSDAYGSGWYVQGTGVTMKDVVTVTLEIPYREINGLVVFESGYTGSSSNKSYDSYKKNTSSVWENLVDASNGLVAGSVVEWNNASCTGFATTVANNTSLKANSTSGTLYSMMCINEVENDKITIKYAYTIRNAGYGLKTIRFVVYNDVAYDPSDTLPNDPMKAEAFDVLFVLSKPISEFGATGTDNTNGFTWLNSNDSQTCAANAGKHTTATGYPETNDICIKYVNDSTKGNKEKPMNFELPKEIAYVHDKSTENDATMDNKIIISSIKDNSIYGTNSFKNVGSTNEKGVMYYYHAFDMVNTESDSYNEDMDPTKTYKLVIQIDASGEYIFYIKDLFGNTVTSDKVTVNDVSITDVIVDYTNEHELTIMEATGAYDGGKYQNNWLFSIDASNTIKFEKMEEDKVTIDIYVFQKVVIGNGVFAGNGTEGSETGYEDIAKQPLGNDDAYATTGNPNRIAEATFWRVADPSSTDDTVTNKVTCQSTEECDVTIAAANYSVGDYSDGRYNKITLTINNNGMYRITITDNFGNSTNSPREGSTTEKNPSVEITVIDRTTPVITSDLSSDASASSTQIESFPYVTGGGEKNPSIPDVSENLTGRYWENTTSYATIYYNVAGSKFFNYQDALNIAKIKVVDDVKFYKASDTSVNVKHSYEVNFGYNANQCLDLSLETPATNATVAGTYCDPTAGLLSDRNSSGTAYNLHKYIIDNNITSFSGGLVKQVGYTDYASDTTTDYTKLTGTTTEEFVNAKTATTFLGYLKIKFVRTSNSEEICTLVIDDNDASGVSNATNKSCFETMNKYIDEVEDFKMVFTATDYNGHTSAEYTVSVVVIDTTAPGIDKTGTGEDVILYSNETTECRLEIDNVLQSKGNGIPNLLDCYKLRSGSTYYFKDNNINNTASNNTLSDAKGTQYYAVTETSDDYYHNKITLRILEDGEWIEATDEKWDEAVHSIQKSGYHQFEITIYDHWATKNGLSADDTTTYKNNNVLTIYVTYYVNPRTILIEPIAIDKMYGEDEPTIDYCVYINTYEDTFYYESHFFDVEFINSYFDRIYCTRDIYVEVVTSNKYTRTSKASGNGYDIYEYTQSSNGTYLKVNNTYVKINEDATKGNLYNMSYTKSPTGEYLDIEGTKYEILSGYTYKDASCLYAYMGTVAETEQYLKINGTCYLIDADNRYTKSYTRSSEGTYLKYNDGNPTLADDGSVNDALVNNNEFAGKLARVESRCYNSFAADVLGHSNAEDTNFATYLSCNENNTSSTVVRNDNVGQYNIVLGTISIKEGEDTTYNEDYVIKMNTNYLTSTFQLGGTQTITKMVDGILVDDGLKTESNVKFTIRQAVLTVEVKDDGEFKRSKKFGQQDPYSNNWNDVTQATNIVSTGYLGGYIVWGWRYNGNGTDSDSSYIITGTLRRQAGEEVGIYDICNIASIPSTMVANDCTADSQTPGAYGANSYIFDSFWKYQYDQNGGTSAAALAIRTNGEVYGTNTTGRTLNTNTRNYAISFIKGDFFIESIDLIIQPGINQGKEYAGSPYNDPLWQLVVYGETIKNNSGTWTSNITQNDSGFTGYTASISVESYTAAARGTAPYIYDGEAESEIYYMRRKVSPQTTYEYVDYIELATADKYTKDGDFYYKSTNGTYIYAHGRYYEILAANIYNGSANTNQSDTGTHLKVVVEGRLVNQTYGLFTSDFVLERASGESVNWYSYVAFSNFKKNGDGSLAYYTLKGVNTGVNQCTIAEGSITVSASGTETCRNYNVVYEKDAPESVKDADTGAITGYQTTVGVSPVYAPDGTNACTSTSHYSKACEDSQKNEILFEIFKREIVLEFIDDNYTFIYGQRYNYYDGGVATSSAYSYNTNTNGIFYIKDETKGETSEGDIFLCYSDIGDYLVDCTGNDDYGITSGDTWAGIGLKFYLHSAVSAYGSGYYGSGTNDKALPAGTYYVYAEIGATNNAETNTAVLNNYKFTYRGGTLTIKPKVTGVQLTSYTKEYGEASYSSYGVGSDYSDYVYYTSQCMADASYLASSDNVSLITDCSVTDNVVGNTYGFVIDGLDSKDTIANNFNGRPLRGVQSGVDNHQYDGVGYYAISAGNIKTITDTSVSFTGTDTVTECITNLDANGIVNNTKCVLVHTHVDGDGEGVNEFNTLSGANAVNYNIDYSKEYNEGAYLFILPASLDITVYENQTKMYGCAYYQYTIDEGSYHTGYTYKDGYGNCNATTSKALDLAYKYNVKGDKDARDASNNAYSSYDVTIDADGNKAFYTTGGTQLTFTSTDILTDGRLYRVTYSDSITYDTARNSASVDNYQGQAVGVYTITLGDLNVNVNGNSMCDTYNNPVLEGGSACRNYNINYYGNSTTDTTDVDTHVYVDKKDVTASDLALYTLNYTADNSGNYVLINGKFVHVNSLKTSGSNVIVSNYVLASSLQKYKKLAQYEKSASGTYVYLDGYKLVTSLTSLRYTDSNGTTQSDSGDYVKVTKNGIDKYVNLSHLTRYEQNYADEASEDAKYATDNSGAYVKINDKYVQLTSLKKYTCADGVCSEAANGTYVLIYETTEVSSLTRYKLSATNATMYAQDGSGTTKNVYAFINGSFVPYNSLTITDGKVNVNMANIKDGTDVVATRGTVSSKVKFIITARVVFVHPEYNVKAYGENDPVEYITCKEIVTAYGISSELAGRESYCTSASADTKVEMGSTMYYAVQNSLAKSPWTVWTDNGKSEYDDIQFDVLTGKVSRMSVVDLKNDRVGKYTFDFGGVTTNDALSGNNYMIVYVTSTGTQSGLTYKTSLDNTYITKDGGGKDTLYNLLAVECTAGSAHCVQGKKITEYKYNGESISLLDKYSSSTSTTAIDYWYLGFYDRDPDRSQYASDPAKVELKKWWQTPDNASEDRVFAKSYNSIAADTTNNIEPEARYMTTTNSVVPRTVYFEIVRRTIYLYAVDSSKIYGESDNYNDFLVAICANSDGYKIENGNVKCYNPDKQDGFGLSELDEGKFLENEAMKQAAIKGETGVDYIFSGTRHLTEHFGIYFRRTPGENAGSYQVTACAAQSDIVDCADRNESEKVGTTVTYLGDNYNIIEVPGTLTIKTRVIDITPDSGQGFQYGNNTEDGSMPNITFTESHNGGNGLVYGYTSETSGVYLIGGEPKKEIEITRVKDGSNYTSLYEFTLDSKVYYIDGIYVIEKESKEFVAKINVSASDSKNTKTVAIGGTTYTIVQKSRCLINVSGLSTICINDGQNEALADSGYYVNAASYDMDEILFGVPTAGKVSELTNREYYTYDVYGDTYSNPANAENRDESMDRSALGLKCGNSDSLRYSRDVCSYVITGGELEGNKNRVLLTQYTSLGSSFYVYITNSKRYSDVNGTNPAKDGKYLKYGDGLIAEIIADNLYDYNDSNDLVKNTSGKYLKVTTTNYNYTIGTINTGTFNVTAAELTVTPVEKQYKIYGEADIEIKFTVETTYVVSRTKYQTYANSNIIKVCNGETCYGSSATPAISSLVSGGKIRLVKGWTVTLNSYAYNEENSEGTGKGNNLDYGVNYTATKHDKTAQVNTQSATSAVHFDKYTDYKNSDIDTSRILIGNLYVDGHDQNVGEKAIVSGLFVAKNNLASYNSGAVNYNLTFTTGKLFVIVPRPVNVEIENIVKTYGQATDSESCDGGYVTSCIVGQGILNGEDNGSLLINNFNVLQKDLEESIPGSSWTDNKLIKSLDSSNVSGIQVVYMTSDGTNIDYSKTNMPNDVSVAITEGTTYYAYAVVPDSDLGKYYTAAGSEEKKNDTLNIAVERGEYNVARASSTCLYDGDKHGCEDVGEYYLKFKVRGSAGSASSTIVNGYYNRYWGYNNNYYVIIYNNFVASEWPNAYGYKQITANNELYYDDNIIDEEDSLEYKVEYVDNTAPKASATIKILKRDIQIVVETIKEYDYQQANEGTHLKVQKAETVDGKTETVDYYFYITSTNRFTKSGEDTYSQSATGNYLCEYSTNIVDENCHEIVAANRYNLVSTKVGEKYAIEQNMDVPKLLVPDNERSTHHTTYDKITWYEIPKQVRTGDKLVGEVAYCTTKWDLGGETTLDTLRNSGACTGNLRYYEDGINKVGNAKFFDTSTNGYYVITRDPTKLYINYSSSERTSDQTLYEVNNYTTTFVNGVLQIDLDETPPVINVDKEFVLKEANVNKDGTVVLTAKGAEKGDLLDILETLADQGNGCSNLVATRKDDDTPSTCTSGTFKYETDIMKDDGSAEKYILEWFFDVADANDKRSFDPSIMRENIALGKRYDARWYIAVQKDFNQQKVGDYSIFLYAQDNAGNISFATMVTLRIVDNTAPEVGTLNLYNAKVQCKAGTDCSNVDNWEVAEDVYLPISTLTSDNIAAMKSDDKGTKYSFVSKVKNADGSYTYTYSANNYFGTYYRITAGSSAAAVLHSGWTNTTTGVQLTVTGGKDNSLAYLDISGYTKYNVVSGAVSAATKEDPGEYIILGDFINVRNLTMYREVKLNGTDESATGTTIAYMPDKAGTIVRYKGYYYNLATGSYIGTGPTDTEYTIKLYSYADGTYTPVTDNKMADEDAEYYLLDGSLYQLPSVRYTKDGTAMKHDDSNGTYINFAQWENYYTRDLGGSWITFSRDATTSVLALGQDGQRLIMIKTIDEGYTYGTTSVTKKQVTTANCKGSDDTKTCGEWQNVNTKDITYTDNNGTKTFNYNISAWTTLAEGETSSADRKYAYLDTILPDVTLTDAYFKVFEYGCSTVGNCSTNHNELFGTAIDGYLFDITKVDKYSDSAATTVDNTNGSYVNIMGNIININETGRRFACSDGTCTANTSGTYVYLGVKDSEADIAGNLTAKVGSKLSTSSVVVYNEHKGERVSVTPRAITGDTSKETSDDLQGNTTLLESGLSNGSGFKGAANESKTFGATITDGTASAAYIADEFTTIFVYAYVAGGSTITSNSFFNQGVGYYKFMISKEAANQYKILRCNSTSVINEAGWCTPTEMSTTYTSMKAAMDDLQKVYSGDGTSANAYDFKDNDITFTIDYRVFDMAGNASYYRRRGALFTSFTRALTIAANGGTESSSLALEIEENGDITALVNDVKLMVASNKTLRADEKILQSVYYNGELVSYGEAKDTSVLSTLDTTVPGSYKVVYQVQRRDGNSYAYGTPVEIMVTVKPNVANVGNSKISIPMLMMAVTGLIAVGLVVYFTRKKETI